MILTAEPGTVIFPLFRNRTYSLMYDIWDFDPSCEGVVSICCLYTLSRYFMNSELNAYLQWLNKDADNLECNFEIQNQPSSITLSSRPVLKSTALFSFDEDFSTYPRTWMVSEGFRGHATEVEVAFEIPFEILKLDWMTEDLGPGPQFTDVTDRSMTIMFAFITPTQYPLINLVLTEQVLIFHDATRNFDRNTETEHNSFQSNCEKELKPLNSLWVVDVTPDTENISNIDDFNSTNSSNNTIDHKGCFWFCRNGYYRLPSSTNWWYEQESQLTNASGECMKEPPFTAVIEFGMYLYVSIGFSNSEYSDLIMDIREVLTEASVGNRNWSIIYVPSDSRPIVNGSDYEFISFSLAIYTHRWDLNLTTQTEMVSTKVVQSISQEFQNKTLQGTTLESTKRVIDIRIVDVRGFIYLPGESDNVPAWLWTAISIWCVLLSVVIILGICALYRRMKQKAVQRLGKQLEKTYEITLTKTFGGTKKSDVADMKKKIKQLKF